MSLFRPVDRHPRGGGDPASSAILHEAILASSSCVRDSLPEQYHAHFEALRQEIIDFAQAHNIPRESLSKPDALREAASKLSLPELERLATLLERFEYLLKNKEPREEIPGALEYTEEHYHLREQYTSQVALLEQVGILKDGAITGIDGKNYPIPTLEQIAVRLFERREELKIKHDQGFTKLLLVPFGMSLDALMETLKQFLLEYREIYPDFYLHPDGPLFVNNREEYYQEADMGDSPKLIYFFKSFVEDQHQGKTKMQILEEQAPNSDFTTGWRVHLLQASSDNTLGFRGIPIEGQGKIQGKVIPRLDLVAGKTPAEYLSLLQSSKDDEGSPYHGETGLTLEDWISTFMTHLTETGQPLDYTKENTETCLIGSFFSLSRMFNNSLMMYVPRAAWHQLFHRVSLGQYSSDGNIWNFGIRTSVII